MKQTISADDRNVARHATQAEQKEAVDQSHVDAQLGHIVVSLAGREHG